MSHHRLKWAFETTRNGAWGDEATGPEDGVICVRAADFVGASGSLDLTDPTFRAIPNAQFEKIGLRPGDSIIEKPGGG